MTTLIISKVAMIAVYFDPKNDDDHGLHKNIQNNEVMFCIWATIEAIRFVCLLWLCFLFRSLNISLLRLQESDRRDVFNGQKFNDDGSMSDPPVEGPRVDKYRHDKEDFKNHKDPNMNFQNHEVYLHKIPSIKYKSDISIKSDIDKLSRESDNCFKPYR